MVDLFQGPIPGQSLTDEPKNAPWENPPELNTVEDAVKYYVKKLSKEEILDDLALVFQLGGTLNNISETIAIMGTMKGIHSVDVQMLVTPVIGSFIKAAMATYGVEVKEEDVDEDERKDLMEVSRLEIIMQDAVEKAIKENGRDEGTELLEGMAEAVASQEESEVPEEEEEIIDQEMSKPADVVGLMVKG
jgi:hypothetical protein